MLRLVPLLLSLAGCVIDKQLYETLRDELVDADGDGFAGVDGDCDDHDPEVSPGTTETWYDGLDADCDEADDFDADQDGDRAPEGDGTDCDDQDASVSGLASEGWQDLGADNDCDGELSEPVLFALDDSLTRLDGPSAGAALGRRLMALPAGWASDEGWLLAAAPEHDGDRGAAYGWSASDLADGPTLEAASWVGEGAASGDVFGFGLGWSGDESAPQVWVSAEGALDQGGEVYGWRGVDFAAGEAPTWTISSDDPGIFAGFRLTEGYDHDADGVADLAIAAPLDSMVANNAGTIRIFTDTTALSDAVALDDADVTLTTDVPGALLDGWKVGDLDGDGRDDLVVFNSDASDVLRGGSFLITEPLRAGTWAVEEVFALQVFGTANAVEDLDLDGYAELMATTADVYRYELPEDDVYLNAEEHADAVARFSAYNEVNELRRGEFVDYGGVNRLIVAAPQVSEGNYQGRVFLVPARWEGEIAMDELELRIDGETPGDAAGTDVVVLPDLDGDDAPELAIGAPGADHNGGESGSVYVVPGAR